MVSSSGELEVEHSGLEVSESKETVEVEVTRLFAPISPLDMYRTPSFPMARANRPHRPVRVRREDFNEETQG
jgi:hypothetical protein